MPTSAYDTGRALLAALAVALAIALLPGEARPGDGPPGEAPGAAPLEVGFGRRSLATARTDISLGGYGGKGLLPALGIHDEPMAKAMVIRTPARSVAVVTVDLVGVQRALVEALARMPLPPGARLRPGDILVAASHTHSSWGALARPTGAFALDALFLACCGPFKKEFFDETLGKIHGALEDACRDLRPARLGVGSAEVARLTHNRGRGDGPVDSEVGVLEVVDARSGAVRGVLVNLAGHPTIVGGEIFLCSADYPGALQRALEARFPGSTALFTQGAEGDLTITVPEGRYEDDWAKVEATGLRIAGEVARIAEGIRCEERVEVAARPLEVELPRVTEGTLEQRLRALGGARRSLVQQVAIGDAVLMGVPGEPCAQIGLDMKAAARARGVAHPFVVGLAQDHCGYFVHADEYAPQHEATHAYEKSLNFHGPAIGRFLVETHARVLDAAAATTTRRGR